MNLSYRRCCVICGAIIITTCLGCSIILKSKIKSDNNINVAICSDVIVPYAKLGVLKNTGEIIITHDVDLGGATCILPPNSELFFNGGIIKNGTIVGENTKVSYKGAVFDDVTIEGSWNVPNISTSMFVNQNETNTLKNVFALANPEIKNIIVIEKGKYSIKALQNDDNCLKVNDHTSLIINGIISLEPNDYERYSVLYLEGDDIHISGMGQVVGDKHTHTGTKGEWGMGVKISNGRNVSIKDITIKDCWGDCIYINRQSKNVTIENCTIDHGRRQGISVIAVDSLIVKGSRITNVRGTKPQYGIDIEPNSGDYVDNVELYNVIIENCGGGFSALGRKKGRPTLQVGSVLIEKCKLSSTIRVPLNLKTCKKVVVKDCDIYSPGDINAVYAEGLENLILKGNEIVHDRGFISSIKDYKKMLKEGRTVNTIEIKDCKKQDVSKNIVKE